MFYFTTSLKKQYWVFYKPHTGIGSVLAAQHRLKYYVLDKFSFIDLWLLKSQSKHMYKKVNTVFGPGHFLRRAFDYRHLHTVLVGV